VAVPVALRAAIEAHPVVARSVQHSVSLPTTAVSDPGATPGDQFGSAIAISGSTALVGAWGAMTGAGVQTGVVYVFTLQGSSWVQTQTISDPGATSGDNFGAAIALSGTTAIIGAWGANTYAGAAYIFNQVGGTWTLGSTLAAASPISGDNFGSAVALSGNYAAVGAWGASDYAGVATVFTLSNGAWSRSQTISDPAATSGDAFATSVALTATTLLIGAPGTAANSGAGYFFGKSGANWSLLISASDPDNATGDQFGATVALAGTDGFIGVPGGASYAGEVTPFSSSTGTWVQGTVITDPNATAGDEFGAALSYDGTTLAVGASGQNVGTAPVASAAGAVYSFTAAAGVWTMQSETVDPTTTTSPSSASGDLFGTTVAVAGASLVAGAPGTSSGAGTFVGLQVPGAQAPLIITNTVLSATVGATVTVYLSGGSGVIAPVFSVTGANCSLSGNQLTANAATSCGVTVTNPANGSYSSVTSAPVTFTFTSATLVAQTPLVIVAPSIATAGSPVTLTSTGGSGVLAVAYGVTGTGCSLSGTVLTDSSPTVCTVSATNPANGNYTAVSATPVTVRFAAATQATLAVTNMTLSGTAGTAISLTTSGGSGTIAVTFGVTGNGCSVSGASLAVSTATTCVVVATNPANGIFDVATSSPVTFTFALAPQASLAITNTTLNGTAGTPLALTTSGGSGVIALTFRVTGTSCSVTGVTLSASSPTTCVVTATNAANGIYAGVQSSAVTFVFSAPVPQAQASLSVTNTTLTGTAGTPIALTSTGGSGVIALTYSVTGTGCSLSGALLSATTATTCVVVATNPANGVYAAVTSPAVSFSFALAAQASLSITSTTLTGTAGTPLTVTTTGGSGVIAVTLSVSGTGCSISGSSLVATTATTCTVTATNPANGVYAVVASPVVSFSFALAAQASLSITNTTLTGTAGTPLAVTTTGGSGVIALTYSVTGTGCSLSGAHLSATTATTCTVTATNPANGIYAVVASPAVSFSFGLTAQATLSIMNATHSGTAGTPITLTSAGGSGTIAVTFDVSGTGCAVSGSVLSASVATTCVVAASNPANGIYDSVQSSKVNFVFSTAALQPQSALKITNTPLTGTVGTPINLTTSGGSGTIAVIFSVTGSGCSTSGSSLSASVAASCVVTAKNAANGIYTAATSTAVTFKFSLATQATLVLATSPLSYARPATAILKVTGGSGTGSVTYAISTKYSNTASATISGTTLTGTKAGYCYVVATKAASGSYAAATSAPVKITFT